MKSETRLREVRLRPARVEAGQTVVVEIDLIVGARGIPRGAALMLDCPGYLGASRPQLLYSENEGFAVVDVSDPRVRWSAAVTQSSRRRWLESGADYKGLEPKQLRNFRWLAVEFLDAVKPGAHIRLLLGAGGGGFSPGCKVGTVAPKPGFQHRFLLRLFRNRRAARPMETHVLTQRVRAGAPVRALLVRRATGATHLVFKDIFGNPAQVADPRALLRVAGSWRRNDHGAWVARKADAVARPRGGMPLADCADMRNVFDGYSLYWGDLHTHSIFSGDVKSAERGEMTPEDLFRYARQAEGLDFLAVTDHNYHSIPSEQRLTRAEWAQIVRGARRRDAPGEFLALAGMEYQCARGDCVFLFGKTPPFAAVSDPTLNPIRTAWEKLRRYDLLTIPHFHNPGELTEGEWPAPPSPEMESVAEIFSCHGRYDQSPEKGMPLAPPLIKARRADRTGAWLLARGLRYGFIADSDDHKSRPGMNGLTAVFMKELTLRGLFEALRARRCYGTTNARIRLVFTVGGVLMGGEAPAAARSEARVDVHGTGPLRCVELLRNGALHARVAGSTAVLRKAWSLPLRRGEYWQIRVLQEDMEMAFSSPVWVV